MLLSDVLENYFVTLSDYKLDDSPLKDIDTTENNWTIRKCVFMCNHLESCKTVTVKKDKTRCKLFSVSVFGIGSTPVKDNEWQTLSISGKRCQSCSFWWLVRVTLVVAFSFFLGNFRMWWEPMNCRFLLKNKCNFSGGDNVRWWLHSRTTRW